MDGIYYTFIKIEDPSISLTIEDPNFKTQKVTVKILNYKCISGHGSGMNSSFYDYLYGDDRDDETKRKRFVSSKKDVLKHYVPNGHSYLRSWHDNWTDKTFIINSW